MEEREKRLINIALSADTSTTPSILETYGVAEEISVEDKHASVVEREVLEAIDRNSATQSITQDLEQKVETAIVPVQPQRLSALSRTGVYAQVVGEKIGKTVYTIGAGILKPFVLPLLPGDLQSKIDKSTIQKGTKRWWYNAISTVYDTGAASSVAYVLHNQGTVPDWVPIVAGGATFLGSLITRGLRILPFYGTRCDDKYHKEYTGGYATNCKNCIDNSGVTTGPVILEIPYALAKATGSKTKSLMSGITAEANRRIEAKEEDIKRLRNPTWPDPPHRRIKNE